MLGESVQLRSIGEWSNVEPEETGLSFVENAILKAAMPHAFPGCRRWPMIPGWRSISSAVHRASSRHGTPMARAMRRTTPNCSMP